MLKGWRTRKGLTLTAAGKLLCASAAALYDWESGHCPKLGQAFLIRDVAKVPLGAWLVVESTTEPASAA